MNAIMLLRFAKWTKKATTKTFSVFIPLFICGIDHAQTPDPTINTLFQNSYKVIDSMRLPGGIYLDALAMGASNKPAALAANGVGLYALCIADAMYQKTGDGNNWDTDAETKALQTINEWIRLKNTPGATNANGLFHRYFNPSDGSWVWVTEHSTIDNAILAAGFVFCRNHFSNNAEIVSKTTVLLSSMDFTAAIPPTGDGLYMILNDDGAGSALTSPFNEYMVLAWFAKNSNPAFPGFNKAQNYWNRVYSNANYLPKFSYPAGNPILSSSASIAESSFHPLFAYYYCNYFPNNPDYMNYFSHVVSAESAWWQNNTGQSIAWGCGAGEKPGGGYSADAINNNLEKIVSPHIMAGYIPANPEVRTNLISLFNNGNGSGVYTLPGTNRKFLWRYDFDTPALRTSYVQSVDFSTMLYGLAALPEYLGAGFFERNNRIGIAQPNLATIITSPSIARIMTGVTQQFTAVGKDQNGSVLPNIPFTWSATGGTINQSGLFTAGYIAGTYSVTATSAGISGTAQAVIAAVTEIVPGVIQAENYNAMLNIQKEPTADIGGGQNVGYIDAGDWMTYWVTVNQTGMYSVNFRVAGWGATGKIELQNASFAKLSAANVPNTGGFQKWATVSGDNAFTLNAGTQIIRIFAAGAPWNLNWFEIRAVETSMLTSISLSPATATITIGKSLQFAAVGKDQYGNAMNITPAWTASGGSMSDTGVFTAGAATGTYTVTATSGAVKGNASVTIGNTVDLPIPGKFEAEAYSVMSGVQKEPCTDTGGGQNIGYIDAGDWLDYPVTVAKAGTYSASFRIANALANGSFQLKNGNTVLADVKVPYTTGWQVWQTVPAVITLAQGPQTLRLLATATGFNLNWIEIQPYAVPASLRIEAEQYTAMKGIQTEPTTDVGGGLNVGYMDPTDYLDYRVNVPATGLFTIHFRIASAVTTGQIELRNQVGMTLATLAPGSTGGYQSWVTKSVNANLSAGLQTLRFYSTGKGLNINWFELVR